MLPHTSCPSLVSYNSANSSAYLLATGWAAPGIAPPSPSYLQLLREGGSLAGCPHHTCCLLWLTAQHLVALLSEVPSAC